MEIMNKVVHVFERLGIDDMDGTNDFYNNIDSFSFIQLVVELEQEFDIEIPDVYLNMDHFSTIEKTAEIVIELISQKSNIVSTG